MTVVFGETMDGSHMAIDQFSLKSNAVTLNSQLIKISLTLFYLVREFL